MERKELVSALSALVRPVFNEKAFEAEYLTKVTAEALAEKPIDKCIGKNEYDVDIIMTGWAFRMNDTFYQCDVSQGIARNGNPEPIELRLYKGLQKSLSESMEDADKAMEQLGY